MSTHDFVNLVASPISAAGAGLTSVIGTAALVVGQAPVPSFLPPDLVYAVVALGPSAIWAVFYGWKMKRAYHARRAALALQRLQALEAAGVPITSEDYEEAWKLYEHHSSAEAVTSAQPDSPPPGIPARRAS